jgi:AraC-like DNA-binding protein
VTHRLALRDLLVVQGSPQWKLSAAGDGELAFWFFSLDVEHLMPLFGPQDISRVQGLVDSFASPRVYPATTPLAQECHELLSHVPTQFNFEHRCQVLRAAAKVFTQELTRSRQPVGQLRSEDHLTQVFESLSAAEILNLSVVELASKFHCGRRHLNRLFHQHFGFSVAALRMEMRLLKAMSLLRDPHAKVMNVAERCGFNHLGLFNTCFKKRFGTSPGQWRKAAPIAAKQFALQGPSPTCYLKQKGLCPQGAYEAHSVGLAKAGVAKRKLGNGNLGNGTADAVLSDARRQYKSSVAGVAEPPQD